MSTDAAEKSEEILPEQLVEEEKVETIEQVEKSKSSKKEKEFTLYDLPSVGAATAEKLAAAGFDNVMSVAVSSPGILVDAAGVTEASARKMIQAARDNLQMGFESGDDVMKRRERVVKIPTGSESFDALLDGGFESGAITEVFAEFGAGKTQIGHLLAVNTIRQNPDATVVYIDTENTFRPDRIKQFATGAGEDPEKVLAQIKVAKAYNSDHQVLLAEKVNDLIKDGNDVRLVIVDSLTAHFRAEFIGRGTLADRQQKINKHMHTLLKLADQKNVAVYVTNQVMAKPDQFFGDPTQAIGGHVVAHASTFRIYLRKGKKGSRVAKLIDAPNLPDGECNFFIESEGLKDV